MEEFEATAHTGVRFYEAERHRLKGELLLSQSADNHIEAEPSFQQALATARHQQAKSLELRAAMSLSRLWQSQGKHSEARQLLAPIYSWFTEGFNTPDLQAAKAMLGELQRQVPRTLRARPPQTGKRSAGTSGRTPITRR